MIATHLIKVSLRLLKRVPEKTDFSHQTLHVVFKLFFRLIQVYVFVEQIFDHFDGRKAFGGRVKLFLACLTFDSSALSVWYL